MKRLKGIISTLLTAILLLCGKQLYSAENTTQITCTVQSPKDGSLWMGTADKGLLRVGRNGRQIVYNKASGHLSSDKIEALSLEKPAEIIFILDGNGKIYSYNSVQGFDEKNGFPAPVCVMTVDPEGRFHYAATAEKLYSFTSEAAPQELLTLPFAPLKITCGTDESLWIIGENGILQVDKNMHTTAYNGDFSASVSNSKPFEFDTPSQEQPLKKERSQALPWILSAILLLALIAQSVRSATRKNIKPEEKPSPALAPVPAPAPASKPAPKPAPMEPAAPKPSTPKEPVAPRKPAVAKEKPAREGIPEPLSDVAVAELREKLGASPFGEKVLALTEENLANPSFGVEQISEKLGISRIHVNRKLKSETGLSPSFVIKAIRMDQARRLLADGKHNVTQVANTCGFSSASYFSTAFKDYYGISPSDFLEKIE